MIKYSTGVAKGSVAKGTLLRDAFRFKNIDNNYTGANVVENFTGDGTKTAFTVAWLPVASVAKVTVADVEKVVTTDYTVDLATGVITFTAAPASAAAIKIAYVYDNQTIPQDKLPTLVATMDGIELHATARRIAVMYSQMAAYEAKQDYGYDLPEQLSAQAVGELSYEIDSQIIHLLDDNAAEDDAVVKPFNITLPVGVGIRDHYLGFLKTIADLKRVVYKKTLKCRPNYMVCSPEVETVLTCMPDAFKASGIEKMAGPYLAGTLQGMKVYVHPELTANTFFLGVNSSDMATSAAVFAPYMPIIPSSLLDFADGTTTQG